MSVAIIQGAEEKLYHVHYEVDTSVPPIGVGGMGRVMRGIRVDETTRTREEVAVKFLFSDLPEHAIDRARREASIRIDSENLIKMYGFIQIDEVVQDGAVIHHYHVVSELLRGVMLADLLKGKVTDNTGEVMPFAEELYLKYKQTPDVFAVFIAKKVLSGLMALHDKGYIHRDVDPSNIMVLTDGRIKLIDFGIAKQLDALNTQDRQLTSAGQFLGKAAYAAPELVLGDVKSQDETTDIYAMGIMLFQLLTGHLPFEGTINEVLEMQRYKPLPLDEIKSKSFRKIIKKATEKKQSERFASCADFRSQIEKMEREMKGVAIRKERRMGVSEKAGGQDATGGNKNSSSQRKTKLVPMLAIISCLVIGGLALWYFNNRDEKADIEDIVAQEETIEQEEIPAIIDSADVNCMYSAAWYLDKAINQLRDSLTFSEGIETLKMVMETEYGSSAESYALMASLYSHSGMVSEEVLGIQSPFEIDYAKARDLNLRAMELNERCYQAQFELALDVFDEERGVAERDVQQCLELLDSCLAEAKAHNDGGFILLINKITQ